MKKVILAALLALASVSAHASRFVVQIGTFEEQQAALAWVPVLEKVGVPAYTEQRGDKTLLRAGPFADRDQAVAALQKVRETGLGETGAATVPEPAKPPIAEQVSAPAPATQHWVSGGSVIVAHQTSNRTGNRIEFSYVPCSRLPETVPTNVPRDPSGYVVFAYDRPGHSPNIGCGVVMSDQSSSVTVVNWADTSEQPYYISSDMKIGE